MTDLFAYFFSDKRFSALGFGARIPPNYEVSISGHMTKHPVIPVNMNMFSCCYSFALFQASYFFTTLGLYIKQGYFL